MTENDKTGLWFDSAADAARAANVSPATIIAAINDGRIPDAYLSSDGWWRVPVEGMRAAGWHVTGEGAHKIGPLDRKLPEPDEGTRTLADMTPARD